MTQTRGIRRIRQLSGMVTYDPVTTAAGLSVFRQASSFTTRVIISRSVKAGRKLLAAIDLGNVLDLFLGQAGLHSRQRETVLFDHPLEVAAVGDEMDGEGFARFGMMFDRLRDLDHPTRFREIEGARREEQDLLGGRHELSVDRSDRTAKSLSTQQPAESLANEGRAIGGCGFAMGDQHAFDRPGQYALQRRPRRARSVKLERQSRGALG